MRLMDSLLVLISMSGFQLPAPQGTAVETPPAESVAAYRGDWRRGLGELRRHVRAGELEQALNVADQLLAAEVGGGLRTALERTGSGWTTNLLAKCAAPLEWLGFETQSSAARAEIYYARGHVLQELQRAAEAREAWSQARLLAGPGGTRLDSVYNLGTSEFLEGEEWRAKLKQPAPAAIASAPAQVPPGTTAEQPDPLAEARRAYLAAREHYLERLRSDWRDEATQANVELCLRRLRELQQLEDERKQQQEQEQQEQQKDQQEGEQQPQAGDQTQPEEPPAEEQSEPQEGQQDQPGEEPQPEPSAEEEAEPQDQGEPQTEGESQQPEERELTKEEVQRLLERLAEHEAEGKEIRERLQRIRRIPVKRDW